MYNFDVAVIGAGPAGVTVGKEIAKAGFDVIIFEKNSVVGKNKFCGGAISKRSALELKLPKRLFENEVKKLVFHFPEETLELFNNYSCMLCDREKLDQYLALQAIEGGAKIITGTKVEDIYKNNEDMILNTKNIHQGKIKKARCQLAVIADGTNTLAYKKFGIGFNRKTDNTALAAIYDLESQNDAFDSLEFFFSDEISPFGYGWIFPRKDLINIGVGCLISKMRENIIDYLNKLKKFERLKPLKILRFGTRLVPQSIPEIIHGDSVLVVGDAAGTANPISGDGIANSIINGKVAAKVAIEALEKNNYSQNFLVKYKNDWEKTENYLKNQKSLLFQRIALKINQNPSILLKKMGYFIKNQSL